ncbi:MAG: RNA 2',3'-cyclic phosphodiesterase [Proteobacteria bacterium]|nr:RNA 2',3'-cyclic phosphodiesterase [Pseudomonadota bacterium]
MKRLFIALEMPEPIRERLAGMIGGIAGARWVDPANFHLTLRFIGEVDGDTAQYIADGLSSLRVASFDLALEGVDLFESRGRVRAIWVGVKPNPALAAQNRDPGGRRRHGAGGSKIQTARNAGPVFQHAGGRSCALSRGAWGVPG